MRTAPEWILDREKGYKRSRRRWTRAMVAGWLGIIAYLILFRSGGDDALNALGASSFVAWFTLQLLRPEVRAQRYELAAGILHAGITRYETALEPAESMLTDADQRAREALRIERKRNAPAWTRQKIRRCRLVKLAWTIPFGAALTAPLIGILRRWHWTGLRAWHGVVYGAVCLVLFVLPFFLTKRVQKAHRILGLAVEQYEF